MLTDQKTRSLEYVLSSTTLECDKMNTVYFKLTNTDAKLPSKSDALSAGYDLFSPVECLIKSRSNFSINLGIQWDPSNVSTPRNMIVSGDIRSRSGLFSKYGVTAFNGLIDASYRGDFVVILTNNSDMDYTVQKGDRVAQLVINFVASLPCAASTSLSTTNRGDGGFGSTGK